LFEEPLLTPEPPFAGASLPALVLVVVGLEPVTVVCEVPFEHTPKNHDWIPLKPFGSSEQAESQTPVVLV
jgi:hypothetical protein